MSTLLNKVFSFRSFGKKEPTAGEVRSELEDAYSSLAGGMMTVGGEPGRGRPRHRVLSNPSDSKPNSHYSPDASQLYIPAGTQGTVSAEGGVYYYRFNGKKVFYQNSRPSQGEEGDVWYDLDDNFRLYVFEDGEWKDVFEEVPEIAPTLLGIDSRTYLAQLADQTDALLAERTDRGAAILHVQRTASSATEATAYDLSVLDAQVNDPTTGLPNSHARITTEQSVRASADGSAIASMVTALTAGAGGATITSGDVVIGLTYKITAVGTGIVVTNIGAADNNLNTIFVATGTTPAAWNGGSLQETRLASVETWAVAKTSADSSLAAEYVLNVTTGGTSGRRVAGFRITNQGGAGGATEFIVQTDKFQIVDSSGDYATSPFKVVGGVVYIKEAQIQEVGAGKITAGTITAAVEMTAATITAPIIRSKSTTNFTTDDGFYLENVGSVVRFRVGTTAGDRITYDTSAGLAIVSTNANVDVGTGVSRVRLSSSGLTLGETTSTNVNFTFGASVHNGGWRVNSGTTVKAFLEYLTSADTCYLDIGTLGEISCGLVNSQRLKALATTDVDTIDSPLRSAGSCYIAGKLRGVGIASFTTTVNIGGALNGANADFTSYVSADGIFTGRDGTAGAVAFAPRQDDENTGMYSDEAGKVKFSCDGTEIFRAVGSGQLFILASGTTLRMGGTNTPITTEALASYITVQGSDGASYKLAIVA